MKGFVNFKYVAKLRRRTDSKKFKEMRQWCWETLGPSCELVIMDKNDNFPWAWIHDTYRSRILLRSDKELAWFKLRWE